MPNKPAFGTDGQYGLADLEKMGIIVEITARKRERVLRYQRDSATLSEGTDPFPVDTDVFGRPLQLLSG